MRNINNKKWLIMFLILIEIASVFLMTKSLGNKNIKEEVQNNLSNNQFVFYIQDAKGSTKYNKSSDSKFPSGYYINHSKSTCVDNEGNKLTGILNGTSDALMVTSKYTVYCEIYLDLEAPILGNKIRDVKSRNLSASLQGGLYRYQGTKEEVTDNYICFGTSDKTTCVNNKEKYMYRILGVNDKGEAKVIKSEYFSDNYIDHYSSTSSQDVSYDTSEIRSSFNGSKFLENTDYVPSGWKDKIVTYKWLHGHTGDVSDSNLYNGYYMYDLETGKIEVTYYKYCNSVGCTASTTKTATKAWSDVVTDKIGMLYIHDYLFAYKGGNPGNYTNAKTSWLTPTWYEWTMTFYGAGEPRWNLGQRVYYISDDGSISPELYSRGSFSFGSCTSAGNSSESCKQYGTTARPVFYIYGTYKSGSGTISDPYLIN